jgi:hypothetical protein
MMLLHVVDGLLLHRKKRLEIPGKCWQFIGFGGIEPGICRNEVPKEVMGHKIIGDKMIDIELNVYQIFTGINAIESRWLVFGIEFPVVSLFCQTISNSGFDEFIGYIRHIGISVLQEQGQIPVTEGTDEGTILDQIIVPKQIHRNEFF